MFEPPFRVIDVPDRYPDSGYFRFVFVRKTDGQQHEQMLDHNWYLAQTNYPFPYSASAHPLDGFSTVQLAELKSMLRDCKDNTTDHHLFEMAKRWLDDIQARETQKALDAQAYNF